MNPDPPDSKNTRPKRPNKFLVKTFDIVSDPKYSEIVTWTDSGLSFEVKNLELFTQKLLPKYFKHRNFASFIRQLNMYNFHKAKDTEALIYSHPFFVKAQKSLLWRVRRKPAENAQANPSNILKSKYNTICSKQQSLHEKIETLQHNYDDVVNHNQSLLIQIFHSKEREQKIFQLLMMFVEQVKEIPQFLRPFYKDSLSISIARPIPIYNAFGIQP